MFLFKIKCKPRNEKCQKKRYFISAKLVFMTVPYINIHTHDTEYQDSISIVNLFPGSKVKFAETNRHRFYSAGIHPWYIQKERIKEHIRITEEYAQNNNIIAIGEAGLDKISQTDYNLQKEVFAMQIKLAEKYNLPLIIHCVKAWDDFLHLRKNADNELPWIFHAFNSGIEMAQQLAAKNCYLSFGEFLLHKAKIVKAFSEIGTDKVFIENDDSKIPIQEIYKKASEVKKMPEEHLKEAIYDNFQRCFQKII